MTKKNDRTEDGLYWTKEDEDLNLHDLGYENWKSENQENDQKEDRRIFRAYLEPWEAAIKMKYDSIAEAQLLQKYNNLTWFDIDEKRFCKTDPDGLTFHTR